MRNVTFCSPNWVLPTATVTPTITGAGWLDLGNLQGEVLSETARYPGVTPADTKFVVDLGTLRNAQVFALPVHNAGLLDTARVRMATDSGFTNVVADSTAKEFFGEVYQYGSLPWGNVSWMDGRLPAELAAGQMPIWWYIAPAEVIGRYVEWAFDFSTNAAGVVDIGQPIVSPALTPAYNVSYGVKQPYPVDPSQGNRSKGGVRFVDHKRPYRVAEMQLDFLSEAETYGLFYDMAKDYGVTKPFLFIYDSEASSAILPRQMMMCTAEQIGPPSHPGFGRYSMAIKLTEAF